MTMDLKYNSDTAKKIIMDLKKNNRNYSEFMSSSNLRKILVLVNKSIILLEKSNFEKESIIDGIDYYKIQYIYLLGRINNLKKFEYCAKIIDRFNIITDTCKIEDAEKLRKFVEALIAYHKYEGGK